MKKKTVGAIASEAFEKDSGHINPQEIQRAQEKEYLANLEWAILHAQKKVPCANEECATACKDRVGTTGSFFVQVLLKKEKLLENVLRAYFIPTSVCPTPTYDQTLFRYDHEKETATFVWAIPDRDTCETFKENVEKIVPEEQQLLLCVLKFYDGTYYRMMKEFNGEAMHLGAELIGV